MNISLEKVTDFLKPFLLKDIIIRTDKKVLKKNYEIPYPYRLQNDEDIGVLNYHLSSFIPKKHMTRVKFLDSTSKSKLYDNLVYILPSNGNNI